MSIMYGQFKKASEFSEVVQVGNVKFGGDFKPIIAGPCAVEEDYYLENVKEVKKAGATLLRGNIFKPRTNPDSFQGIGLKGLILLREARQLTGLPIVTEVMDLRDLEQVIKVSDMIQIGARNMQNFPLLKEVGRLRVPVLLKRGFCATIEEWLQAARYIAREGNNQIVFCERGIRTFENSTRFTLDIASVPVVKEMCDAPIIVDPSHCAGKAKYIIKPLAKAALAVGADGLMIEAHLAPDKSSSDSEQALTPQELTQILTELNQMQFNIMASTKARV